MRTGRIAAVAFFLCASVASGDTISLNNGDKVTGVIEEINPASIIVTTPYAGKLTIDRKAVKTLKSDKAVMIVGADGGKTEMFVSPTAEGAGAGSGWRETVAVAPPLPPPEPPRGTTFLEISPFWKNQATLGVVNTTGNDQTVSFAASVLFHYLKQPDEFTLKFEGNYGKSNGQQNAGLFDENAIYRHDISAKIYGYVDDDVRLRCDQGDFAAGHGDGWPGVLAGAHRQVQVRCAAGRALRICGLLTATTIFRRRWRRACAWNIYSMSASPPRRMRPTRPR